MSNFVKYDFVTKKESELFGKNQENRAINRGHVKSLKEQFEKSIDIMPAITINVETNHIIDGQHRLAAFQDLVDEGKIPEDSKLKVMYVSVPEEEEKQTIIDANTNSKNWSIDDYIVSYVKAGIHPYIVLNDWCKQHDLTSEKGKAKFRYGASIITGKRCQSSLKDGTFDFTFEELKRADEIHEEMSQIIEILGIQGKGAWIEALACKWIEMRDMNEWADWKATLQHKKSLAKLPKSTGKDWENIFAQVHTAIDKKAAK